jgi:hypothetical protein
MLVLGAVLLAWMLAALLRGVPQPVAPAAYGRLAQVVHLPGLSFAHPERLFDSADHRALVSNGAPVFLANAVREERRRLALLWLRLLRDDVNTLWRFRRMMAAHGSSAGAAGELRLALAGAAAIGLIYLLRLAVTAAGPFQTATICRASRNRVEMIWQACAGLFGRIPAEHAGEFERAWASAFPATQGAFSR